MHLTMSELSTAAEACRIAAEQYDADARTCDGVPAHARTAEHFRELAKRARALCERIEGAE